MKCGHNARGRYQHGFYCEDCDTFFEKDSSTYRSTELLSSIWMVLHNINADSIRGGKGDIKEVLLIMNKIGIGKSHTDYENLIKESEIIMTKYNKDSNSASVLLSL